MEVYGYVCNNRRACLSREFVMLKIPTWAFERREFISVPPDSIFRFPCGSFRIIIVQLYQSSIDNLIETLFVALWCKKRERISVLTRTGCETSQLRGGWLHGGQGYWGHWRWTTRWGRGGEELSSNRHWRVKSATKVLKALLGLHHHLNLVLLRLSDGVDSLEDGLTDLVKADEVTRVRGAGWARCRDVGHLLLELPELVELGVRDVKDAGDIDRVAKHRLQALHDYHHDPRPERGARLEGGFWRTFAKLGPKAFVVFLIAALPLAVVECWAFLSTSDDWTDILWRDLKYWYALF